MQRKIFVAGITAVAIILFSLGDSVIAEDERFTHSIQYNIGGRISIDREFGHACTTGAVKKQQVRGYGEMTKTENVRIAPNIMAVDEETDWSSPDDAIGRLSVVTTIELCNRPMSTAAQTYSDGGVNIIEVGDVVFTYHPLVILDALEVNAATAQIWETFISTNPGEEGSYHSDFIAAYGFGPYEFVYGFIGRDGNIVFPEEDFIWELALVIPELRDDRIKGYKRGDYYVGNFFEIDQYAYTSGGFFERNISMSSPFTGSLLEEELFVIGMAEVRESFEMHNLEAGPKAITLRWYELF